MRLIDADALAEKIQENMNNGFPANENLSLYALLCKRDLSKGRK